YATSIYLYEPIKPKFLKNVQFFFEIPGRLDFRKHLIKINLFIAKKFLNNFPNNFARNRLHNHFFYRVLSTSYGKIIFTPVFRVLIIISVDIAYCRRADTDYIRRVCNIVPHKISRQLPFVQGKMQRIRSLYKMIQSEQMKSLRI